MRLTKPMRRGHTRACTTVFVKCSMFSGCCCCCFFFAQSRDKHPTWSWQIYLIIIICVILSIRLRYHFFCIFQLQSRFLFSSHSIAWNAECLWPCMVVEFAVASYVREPQRSPTENAEASSASRAALHYLLKCILITRKYPFRFVHSTLPQIHFRYHSYLWSLVFALLSSSSLPSSLHWCLCCCIFYAFLSIAMSLTIKISDFNVLCDFRFCFCI